ncbi:MAG: 16S rRNA (uracil(1498)-N(3))-methyltransferase [Corynebacterium sp.]|nr:16S rRNA (uracil(1498)-N(3))-methyltransferase [Corynebacterium sp.]
MSLPAFVHPNLSGVVAGDVVELGGSEGRHAVAVKRISVGEKVLLIPLPDLSADGDRLIQLPYPATRVVATVAAIAGKDTLTATVDSVEQLPTPQPLVTVVQAIPKSERAELAIDLSTQGGADAFIAWQADRCVARWDAKKAPKAREKWQAAAIAAAKQSRRANIPAVRGPVTTAQLVQLLGTAAEDNTALFLLHEEATNSVKDVALPTGDNAHVILIIGPEGGIGAEETAQLEAAGAVKIKLGPEVLRTASAGIVALAALGVRTERW